MARSAAESLVAQLPANLARSGFNVAGALTAAGFDALAPEGWQLAQLLPEARSVVVLGSGGPDFFRALRASAEIDPLNPVDAFASAEIDPLNPVDAFASAESRRAAAEWSLAGWKTLAVQATEQRPDASGTRRHLDFVALGRACGLGSTSRLGLLLHPRFGPWWAIRSLLVTQRRLGPTAAISDPSPCEGCPAPCTRVCPAAAPQPGGFDAPACMRTRAEREGCRLRCDARHACVIGQEHAYEAEAEAHHMLAALQRHSPGKPMRR